jgi:hypothetical protein
MRKRLIIIIGLILVIFISLIVVGFLRKRQVEQKINVVTFEEKPISAPLPIKEEKISQTTTFPTQPLPPTTQTKAYQLLFDQPFLYLDLEYPLLYIYDHKESIIKYLNLEDETYKEIFKAFNLKNAFISEDKTKIVIETENGFSLLDINKDELRNLPPITEKIVFAPETILYLNDQETISYLAYFKDGKITKIRNLGILNPEFAVLKNGLLIYEENSPVFFLDLKKPSQLSIFLPAKENYDLLVNKNKDLIFVNFKENNNWQSQIIDLNKKAKYSFPWGTIREKCSFDDLLVCALSINLNPENWRIFESSFDEKIIIYNPQNNEIKEINLEEKFDTVKPKLTPLGIIYWNRLDAKFYLLKVD